MSISIALGIERYRLTERPKRTLWKSIKDGESECWNIAIIIEWERELGERDARSES